MTKIQKIWMWIFVAMFALPEILFFTTPLLIGSLLGRSFLDLSSLVINYEIFLTRPFYLLAIIIVEWIGMLGLLITTMMFSKKIIAIVPFIILLWLSFVFCIVYVTGISMNW